MLIPTNWLLWIKSSATSNQAFVTNVCVYDRLTVVAEFDVIELLSARLVPYVLVNDVVAEFIQTDDVGEWFAARL